MHTLAAVVRQLQPPVVGLCIAITLLSAGSHSLLHLGAAAARDIATLNEQWWPALTDAAADMLPFSSSMDLDTCSAPAGTGRAQVHYNYSAAMLALSEEDVPADGEWPLTHCCSSSSRGNGILIFSMSMCGH